MEILLTTSATLNAGSVVGITAAVLVVRLLGDCSPGGLLPVNGFLVSSRRIGVQLIVRIRLQRGGITATAGRELSQTDAQQQDGDDGQSGH